MTSKNLFWVRCKENNKRRIWVWIVSILLQLVSYPAVMTVYLSRIQFWNKEGMYATKDIYKTALYEATADAIGFQPKTYMFVIILALLIGMQGFSYLYDRKKVDMYHSVPIPMESRYATIYWNGIASYLIPCIASIFIAILIALTQGAMGGTVLAECGYAFVLNLLFFLVIYHTTILAVMLTGNKVITGFLIFGFLFLEYFAVQLYNGLKYTFFDTADNYFTNLEPQLSPIYDYSMKVYELKWETDLTKIGDIIFPMYIKWFVLMAVLGVIAYLCYWKRPAESAGKAIAFGKAKPVLKVVIATMVGAAICYLVYESAYYNVWITVLAMLAGTILCCGALEVIFEFDIRAMIKHLVSSGVSIGIVLIIFCIYHFDILGYDTYVPDVEDVESFALYTGTYYQDYFREGDGYDYITENEYYKQNMFLTSVEEICELVKKSQNIEGEEMGEGRQFYVLYRLKSGREVSRRFYVDFDDASNEELLNEIVGNEEYINGVYQIAKAEKVLENKTLEISYSNGTVEKALPSVDAEKIKEAWLKDMEQFDFSLARHNRPCGKIELLFTDCYNIWNLPVYDSFTNTIDYLKENNAYYPLELNPEDIASVTVTNYHYSLYEEATLYEESTINSKVVATSVTAATDVTETFTEPEEIAEIVAHIYPTNLDLNWNSVDELEQDYEITIAFKAGADYPYGAGYYYYQFINGEVPGFVEEATAWTPEE
ncbi:MAG: hypothetical protein J6B68_07165 [Lachnospiraceae bacterium]|nr:hypothetical protein [Lachnospiraceae bacterium]